MSTAISEHQHPHAPPASLRRIAGAFLLLIGLVLALASTPVAQAAAPGEAEVLAASPVPLTSVVSDPTTNIIYALEYSGRKVFSYNPSGNMWTELAEAPNPSGNNGGATFLNGKIYASTTGDSAHVEVYDIASGEWTQIANPLGQGTTDITTAGEEIYMADGTHFIKYNPATTTTTTLPEPPSFAPAECGAGFQSWGGLQAYNGKIYGDQGDGCRGFGVYDIATETWTELPLTPLEGGATEGPVAGSALDPVSGTYFAYGGYEENVLFEYDIAAGTWSTYTLPFNVNDGGLAYLTARGLTGIYAIQGQAGTQFARFVTPEPAPPAPAPKAAETPKATPVVTSSPVVPAKAAPAPPAPCVSGRSETVHWKVPRGVHLKDIVITLNGAVYAKLRGSARSARISLAGRRAGTVRVKVAGRTAKGRPLTSVRVFHPCTAKRTAAAPMSLYLAGNGAQRR